MATKICGVHDLVNARRYADNLVAMLDGHVVARGDANATISPELVRTLYHVACQLIQDPLTNSPILTVIKCCEYV